MGHGGFLPGSSIYLCQHWLRGFTYKDWAPRITAHCLTYPSSVPFYILALLSRLHGGRHSCWVICICGSWQSHMCTRIHRSHIVLGEPLPLSLREEGLWYLWVKQCSFSYLKVFHLLRIQHCANTVIILNLHGKNNEVNYVFLSFFSVRLWNHKFY